jgi:hypothetical protein
VTDLDLATGHVFVRQNWRYHWVVDPESTTWTHDERFHFHNVDHMIWALRSLRARFDVRRAKETTHLQSSTEDLVSRFGDKG